jgi:predicted permease
MRAPYKLRSLDEIALFLHLVGGVTLFAGMAVAGVGLALARRRERSSEIALLLGLTRIGVVLVVAGLALAVACGFWLLDLTEFDLGDAWVAPALLMVWKP